MKVHLIGIGGTGMGAVAGLLAAAGHDVRGSDTAVYPPMSEQLAALGIPVFTGYAADNLAWGPDLVVVGNVHGKDHVEVAAAQARGIELTSFPALLGDHLLTGRHSIVVSGTHGKTTTTSVIAHILVDAGRDPSFFVGGVPIGVRRGWRLGQGEDFVVEGDEYDSAFFDKGSKFLHYRPRTAVLTSIELDHVDIFSSIEDVRDVFRKFVALIPADGLLVVCNDQPDAVAIASDAACRVQRYAVADEGQAEAPAGVTWWAQNLEYGAGGRTGRVAFDVFRDGDRVDRFETLLVGRHNVGNVLAAIAVAFERGVAVDDIRRAVSSFAGIRRRQELRGIASGVTILDDYAHHPTAVRETLKALRKRFPGRRLIAVYEPRSATSRRRTFQDEFVDAFAHADEVIVGSMYDPTRIPKDERFDPERLALDLHRHGTKASYLPEVDAIVRHIVAAAAPGDVVVVLSSGSFEGLHDKLLAAIGDAVMPARRTDVEEIRALVGRAGLADPVDDTRYPSYFCLRNESGLAGVVALEVHGEEAILRSLAVAPDWRGAGYGWLLADTAINHARHRGVRRIYLLTETASDFFAAKHGFRVVDRTTVSPAVAASDAFQGSTASSFVAMRLDL
ncbi:MAG: UDP-N-acetylmuramate:L-alanyl-gamma-D-glutamyl-meso-diaminopimelate ligase [Myxococcales bacterium]|nr:UDP-N-acetylmuramate:L-alanyl-gamma-D-glutamyl-meso-diaminopimelate ligase [Myxococcales bacterium]